MTGIATDPLAGLDEDQRVAATAVSGPVVIIAGAGAGKTRTVTSRIAHAVATGAQPADRGLAVTFTTKAAGEMRQRLAALGVTGVQASTIHSAALRQLRHFWPSVVGGSPPQIIASKFPLVAEAAASCGVGQDRSLIRDIASEIEWSKVTRVAAEAYPAAVEAARRAIPGGLTPAELAKVYAAYGDITAQRGVMDFEDVLLLTVAMLEDQPAVADQVRSRYRWFTVDEYQDVSRVQHDLISAWLGERDELCVVGDPGQTIYSFAGATSHYLRDFTKRFPHASSVTLVRTYRCSPQITSCANALLAAGSREGGGLRLKSQVDPGPEVEVTALRTDADEADHVAEQIRNLIASGQAAQQIAVLFRTNAASVNLEESLAESGIAYTVRGGERFFERPEVREAVTRLRGAAAEGRLRPPDQETASMDSAAAEDGPPLARAVAETLAAMSFDVRTPPAGRGAQRDRWENLAAIWSLAATMAEADRLVDMAGLVAELDRRATLQAAPGAHGVTLASLHAAKGLEWDVVFLVGLSEGNLPIVHADTPPRIEEERRLLYVGVTRARQRLLLSRARQHAGGGRRRPSRFLEDLGRPELASGEQPRSSTTRGRGSSKATRRRRGPGRCRICGKGLVTAPERALLRCRTCPDDIDPELLDELRAWRLDESRRRSAPAYTVFTDTTLQAVAEQRPATLEALADIPGVGPVKLERYGEILLVMVATAAAR